MCKNVSFGLKHILIFDYFIFFTVFMCINNLTRLHFSDEGTKQEIVTFWGFWDLSPLVFSLFFSFLYFCNCFGGDFGILASSYLT